MPSVYSTVSEYIDFKVDQFLQRFCKDYVDFGQLR